MGMAAGSPEGKNSRIEGEEGEFSASGSGYVWGGEKKELNAEEQRSQRSEGKEGKKGK